MTYGVVIMYLVAAVLGAAGTVMLLRLRSPRTPSGRYTPIA